MANEGHVPSGGNEADFTSIRADLDALRRAHADLARTIDTLARRLDSVGTSARTGTNVHAPAPAAAPPTGVTPLRAMPAPPPPPAAGPPARRGPLSPVDTMLGESFGQPRAPQPTPEAAVASRPTSPAPERGYAAAGAGPAPANARRSGDPSTPDVPEPLFYVPPLLPEEPADGDVVDPLALALGSEFVPRGTPPTQARSTPAAGSAAPPPPAAAAPAPPPPPAAAAPAPPPPPAAPAPAPAPAPPPAPPPAAAAPAPAPAPPPPPAPAEASPSTKGNEKQGKDFAATAAMVNDILAVTPASGGEQRPAGSSSTGGEDGTAASRPADAVTEPPITPDFFTAPPPAQRRFRLRR
jgi:hypothetical protein